MTKTGIGAKTYMCPMPIVIVGANVNGKPNYLTLASCGMVQHAPPMVSVTMNKCRYTREGIKENGTFSVNIPSEDNVEVTDYVGIHSGREIDKSTLFDNFYGMLKTAPMIEEFPVNLECRVVQTVDFEGPNEMFIGEIVEVYADEQCLTEDLLDIQKIRPMVFAMHGNNYWKVGEHIGRAWKIGKDYQPKPV